MIRFLFACCCLLALSACGPDTSPPDPHRVDGPLRPIDIHENRTTQAPPPGDLRRQELLRGQDMAQFLSPRLVAIMAELELAESVFNTVSQVEWLTQARVAYRRVFNEINLLSRRYNYVVSPELPVPIQAQVDALKRLSPADFRRQYPGMLRRQLLQLDQMLTEYAAAGLSPEYEGPLRSTRSILQAHLSDINRLF